MNLNGSPAAPSSGHPVAARSRWLRAWWSRIIAGLAFAAVATVTGRISYIHIKALSLALHQSPDVAQIMPFGVDGLIVVGSVALLQPPEGQPWLGWVCVIPGSIVSLYANVMSAVADGAQSAAWAGVASLSFIAATYTLERWLTGQFGQVAQDGPAALARPAAPPATAGELPGPLTPQAALLALIGTGTRRETAALLGVPKTRVDRWHARLSQPGAAGPDVAAEGEGKADLNRPDERQESVADLNGSQP